MKFYKTKRQKLYPYIPTKIQFSTVAANRLLYRTNKELYGYKLMMIGEEGENILLEYIEKYGGNDWIVIPNIWLNKNGNFECDLILITSNKIYVFEVKNYTEEFLYKNHSCYLNGKQIDTNCIEQSRRALVKLERIFEENYIRVPIEMINVFTNADCHVIIESEIEHSTITPRHSMKRLVERILKEDREYNGKTIDTNKILNTLHSYELDNDPFMPPAIADVSVAKAGICCDACGSFKVEMTKVKVSCVCGNVELKERAILRTIREYGILTYDKNFSPTKVMTFLNNCCSMSYLIKILRKYFKVNKNHAHTTYQNVRFSVDDYFV